jgi:general L-amino acid transport system permease protein
VKPGAMIGWLGSRLFSNWTNTCITLILVYLGWRFVPALLNWAVVNAVWSPANASLCRETATHGACWAFVAEKFRFILFGTFPADQQWRPALVIVLLLSLCVLSAWRILPLGRLSLVWLLGLAAIGALMSGGVFGLGRVENERWGGLCLTLLLTTFGLCLAFPLSILLALGRRSELPLVRALCIGYIELIRGVPLISLLFMASVMLPLFLPAGVSIDKLLRIQLAMILFAAAYLAEVVRGGLQSIPKHQDEAALALGLSYWQRTFYVTLPQALRVAIPPLVNTFIGFFKDTSLVVIIGLFDFLTAIKVSLTEPRWSGFGVEAYLFAAMGYFLFCYPMSRYSQTLERHTESVKARETQPSHPVVK